jgi:hypothetical protein
MIRLRKIALVSLTLLILISGCKKSNLEPIENTLIGKWTYTEYYISPGGPGEWRAVTPPNQTIEFKSNGKFIPCESFLEGSNRFEILDSVTVKFEPASTPSGFLTMGYSIDTAARELQMWPVNPMCIEGCSSKFKR